MGTMERWKTEEGGRDQSCQSPVTTPTCSTVLFSCDFSFRARLGATRRRRNAAGRMCIHRTQPSQSPLPASVQISLGFHGLCSQ